VDRGAWWATVYGVTKSPTQLSDFLSPLFLCRCPVVLLLLGFLPCPSLPAASPLGWTQYGSQAEKEEKTFTSENFLKTLNLLKT